MFRIATLNVRALPLMPQAHVVDDVRLGASNADVILWQEIGPDRYKQAIRDLGPEWEHWLPPHLGNAGPISWRKGVFARVDQGVELLHKGEARVTADRGITWVKLRRKGTRRVYAFVNTHYVPRAWYHDGTARLRHDPAEAAQQPHRQAMWREGNARHRALIERFVKQGVTVLGGGDFNRGGNYPVVGRLIAGRPVQYVDAGAGLDYLYVIPNARTQVIVHWAKNFRGHTDHPLKVAALTLKGRLIRRK